MSWLCHYNLSPFKAIVNDELKTPFGASHANAEHCRASPRGMKKKRQREN